MIFANPLDETWYRGLTIDDREAAIARMREVFLSGYRSLQDEVRT